MPESSKFTLGLSFLPVFIGFRLINGLPILPVTTTAMSPTNCTIDSSYHLTYRGYGFSNTNCTILPDDGDPDSGIILASPPSYETPKPGMISSTASTVQSTRFYAEGNGDLSTSSESPSTFSPTQNASDPHGTIVSGEGGGTKNDHTIIALGVVGCIFGVVGLGAAAYFFFHKRRLKRALKQKDDLCEIDDLKSVTRMRKIDPVIDAETQRLVNGLEMPLASLEFGDNAIGKGEHGIVYKGLASALRCQTGKVEVAIKVMKRSSDGEETKQFIEEIKMMIRVGRHLNLVNLLGVTLKGRVLAVLEYCPYGSLHSFLKENAAVLHEKEPSEKPMPPATPVGILYENNPYADYRNGRKPDSGKRLSVFSQETLSNQELVEYAFQISRGMEYLASQRVVHRDLAARNILVHSRKIVKISDFGMARYTENEYVMAKKAALPVKWMPPEAITTAIFSQKSDVWSYGVLLWEMFSMGQTPYSNLPFSGYINELVAYLRAGNRLEPPERTPSEMSDLMRSCWELWPEDRPDFTAIRERLQKEVAPDDYLQLDETYSLYNREHYSSFATLSVKEDWQLIDL